MPPLNAPQDEERIEDQLEHLKELHLQASAMEEIANPPRHRLICRTASTSSDGDSAYAGTHGCPSVLLYVSLLPFPTWPHRSHLSPYHQLGNSTKLSQSRSRRPKRKSPASAMPTPVKRPRLSSRKLPAAARQTPRASGSGTPALTRIGRR